MASNEADVETVLEDALKRRVIVWLPVTLKTAHVGVPNSVGTIEFERTIEVDDAGRPIFRQVTAARLRAKILRDVVSPASRN